MCCAVLYTQEEKEKEREKEKEQEGRMVYHYMFEKWPDHGEPRHLLSVLNFIAEFHRRQRETGNRGPIIMHCRYSHPHRTRTRNRTPTLLSVISTFML